MQSCPSVETKNEGGREGRRDREGWEEPGETGGRRKERKGEREVLAETQSC